jgi:hypothetical protein
LPWLHLGAFALFVVRAYASLGHWPSYGRPDPKDLGFVVHHAIVWLSLLPAAYSAIVFLPASIALRRTLWIRQGFRSAALIYVAGTLLTWIVWGTDLGGLSEWFAD